MTFPLLAGFQQEGTMAAPLQLWAGEAPIIDESSNALAAITQYQLIAVTDTGVTPYVVATHVPAQAAIAQIGGAIGARIPYWNAGKFNHSTVIWPASLTTLAQRKAFLNGTMLHPAHLIVF